MSIAKNLRAFLLFFFLVIGMIAATAQEKHFVYIQSENKQAFYVRLNDKMYNSTKSGYLILSQLISGKYYLITGFSSHDIPEQNFVLDITKDAGYALKQFGDKGWGLFDIINFTTVMADNRDSVKSKESVTANSEKPVSIISNEKPEAEKPNSSNTTVDLKKPAITKYYENQNSKGFDQVYVDISSGKPDTIAVFIPKEEINTNAKKSTEVVKKKCSVIASKDDFYQTRADMAASTNDDAMIQVAKRSFKTKCFSTEQIKNLGVLFLSEPARYKFFETAKASISDVENYPSLEAQFSLPSLIEKFRASVKIN
jgi:hypothetical protein